MSEPDLKWEVAEAPLALEERALRETHTETGQEEEKTNASQERKRKTIEIEGECGYLAFRRYIFKAVYPHAARELIQNPGIIPERDGNPGQIHVEADGKKTLYGMDDGLRLVSVGHVLGVIYNSRSGHTMLRWREGEPTGRVWGQVTQKSLGMLLSCKVKVRNVNPPERDRCELVRCGGGRAAPPRGRPTRDLGKLEETKQTGFEPESGQ